jgi:hypothetical protein
VGEVADAQPRQARGEQLVVVDAEHGPAAWRHEA